MVVNSIKFWIFFIVVLVAYYGLFRKSSKLQNLILLIASYIFYGMVDWKMSALLLISTGVFYFIGAAIAKNNGSNEKVASRLTTLGVLLGVGMLFYFKYLDFFVEQFGNLLSSIGLHNNINTFGIIMPLGISFFTFKLISYVIEVHRETIEPSKDPIAFATFVAFFPTIMSGPIDRPKEFITQLDIVRRPEYSNFSKGVRRIIWGMFLKMCIADRIALYTDVYFGNISHYNGGELFSAALAYTIQMYTDFCGYSEMAIGTALLLGITIRENFNRPFFATDMSKYWRRWHMSLTSWITDYVFMPLNVSFRNIGKLGLYLATLLNLVIIGAWHGANWTFVLFGVYHGILLIIVTISEKRRKSIEKKFNLKNNKFYLVFRMAIVFILVTFGLIIFRANNIKEAFDILYKIFSSPGHLFIPISSVTSKAIVIASLVILLFKDMKDEFFKDKLPFFDKPVVRTVMCALIFILTISCGVLDCSQFIYVKF